MAQTDANDQIGQLAFRATDHHRWPSFRAILALCLVAAAAVAADTYFNAQEGLLARPPGYDGAGYMVWARTAYLLLIHLHPRQALIHLNPFVPLWTALLAFQNLVLGDGTWQAFTVRFWGVAPLLILVYWIVRRRATQSLALAAALVTALLPLVSGGVRSSSWEFLTGHASYIDDWYQDDLRPDFLAGVLVLWSIALLAEDSEGKRRSVYLASATFAAAAVLTKPSTAPAALAVWAATLALHWFWHRKNPDVLRMSAVAVGFAALLLFPWAVLRGGAQTVVTYLYAIAVSYSATYGVKGTLTDQLTYFLVQLPNQLGHIEVWPVIAGALLLAIAMLLRQLGPAEAIYAATVIQFYLVFTLPGTKNPHLGEWISMSLWVFFLAGVARVAARRWVGPLRRASPFLLAAAATYTVAMYALGAVALANWPLSEQRSHEQLLTMTAGVAQELRHYVPSDQCFAYAPGPGWPASLQYMLMDDLGSAPSSTEIDIDPKTTTVKDYVVAASRCEAILAYREDITQVSKIFYAPPPRQPYLRAVAEWVRTPSSGFSLDRAWHLSELVTDDPHPLGHSPTFSLTLELYVRSSVT